VGKRFHRGISPVIAVLLLIIIAVAAGLLIYIWISGYMSSQTSSLATQPPKIAGASARWVGDNLLVELMVHNPSTSDAQIDIQIDDGAESTPINTTATVSALGFEENKLVRAGELKKITIVLTSTPSETSITVFIGVDGGEEATGDENPDLADKVDTVYDFIILPVPPR